MALINVQAETLFREETTYGVKDSDGIKRILGAVLNGYGNMEFYPGVINKAAAYWYKMATSQMFHNGNKRTALMSGLYYLVMNGFILKTVDGNNLYRLTLDIANERMTQSELESFIRTHVGLRYFSSLAEVESDDRFELKIPFQIDDPDRTNR
jgi:death-on-curing family protein